MTETLSPLGQAVWDSGFWSFELVSDFVLPAQQVSDFEIRDSNLILKEQI
jgi:hypothetical protein